MIEEIVLTVFAVALISPIFIIIFCGLMKP